MKLKVYVGSSTVVHKPLWWNKLNETYTFLLVNTIKMLECYWSKHCASSGQQKHITKASDRFHNHSGQLTMFKCTLAANRGFSLVWPLAFMKSFALLVVKIHVTSRASTHYLKLAQNWLSLHPEYLICRQTSNLILTSTCMSRVLSVLHWVLPPALLHHDLLR